MPSPEAHPSAEAGIRRLADGQATAALSPIEFLVRSAIVWRDRVAVRHGERATTYDGLLARVRRLAGALHATGCGEGDRVAVLLPNVPEMLEAHFGAPA